MSQRTVGGPLHAKYSLPLTALIVVWLAVPAWAQAEPADAGGFPEKARRVKDHKKKPLHLGLSGGVFQPWDGDVGFDVAGSLHVGLGSDRFWVGAEMEYRRYEAELKRNYRPDVNSWLLRFSFQYHPFPQWVVSPYCGIQVGVAIHKVDDNHARNDPSDEVRSDVSGGLSMVGLAGAEVPLFTDKVHFFAEGRLGNTSDLWKRKGGNYQSDQVDGVTGMGGLRFRF